MEKSNDFLLQWVKEIKNKVILIENDLMEFENKKAKNKAAELVEDVKLLKREL